MATSPRLYYTQADLQYRYWTIASCLAEKGAHFCCEKQNGNTIDSCTMQKFKKAHAFLELICTYTALAPLNYANESQDVIDATNCITEAQMDKIMAWFESYCCMTFLAKEMAPQKENGTLDLVPPIAPDAFVDESCLLELENGFLILLEDDSKIVLEDATCNPPLIPQLVEFFEGDNNPNF